MIKSEYFKNRYKSYHINNFYIFYYIPINKSGINLNIYRLLHLNNLKHLMLPSSFKLVKNQRVQGPRIGIIYSYTLNFKQLSYFNFVKATSFKLKDKWYAYQLLEDLKFYKEAANLCINLDLVIKKKNLELFQYFKNFALKNTR